MASHTQPAQPTPVTSAPTMRIGPLQLRSLTANDMPQLQRIYASSRSDEPLLNLWPQEHLPAFLQSQCHAQHQHYTQHYAGAEFKLLEMDGQLAGRLYWQCQPNALRLIEITLLPEFRARGVGTLLVQHLQAVAAQHRLPMALQVACTNQRALALYQRLGFALGDTDGVFYAMQYAPIKASQAEPAASAAPTPVAPEQAALTS